MAREQDRLTLLFAHLQTLPGGAIPALLGRTRLVLLTLTWPAQGGGWEQEHTESSEARNIHKSASGQKNGTRRGRGMDVDTSPVPTSEEEAEGIGGLSPVAEPACCSPSLGSSGGIGTDLPCKDTLCT